jgi:hypothetical protein
VRTLAAIATVVLLLAGLVAPHHHPVASGTHECVACTVGGGLEARDATPAVVVPQRPFVAAAAEPASGPVTGAPLGAVPGQSPPSA